MSRADPNCYQLLPIAKGLTPIAIGDENKCGKEVDKVIAAKDKALNDCYAKCQTCLMNCQDAENVDECLCGECAPFKGIRPDNYTRCGNRCFFTVIDWNKVIEDLDVSTKCKIAAAKWIKSCLTPPLFF